MVFRRTKEMRPLFYTLLLLTSASTCVVASHTKVGMDLLLLLLSLVVQASLLTCLPVGEASHFAFILTVSYSCLVASDPLLSFACLLLLLTLLLRLLCGGCIFGVVEKEASVRKRESWVADAQLLSLLLVGVARLRMGATCEERTKAVVAGGVTAYMLHTW